MKPDLKKLVILNLPYLLFVWLFGKMGEAWRLGSLLYGPDRPAVADKPISRIYDGYYRQLNFSV